MQQHVAEEAPCVFLSTDWLGGIDHRVHNYQNRGETYSHYDRMWV